MHLLVEHRIELSLKSSQLIIVPYAIFVPLLIAFLVVALQNPRIVQIAESGMYCIFSDRTPGRVSALMAGLILLPTVAVEVQTCGALRKKWALFKHQKDSLSMIIRVLLFTCFGILAVILGAFFFFEVESGAPLNIVLSLLPVAFVLVFGTHSGLLRVWMFWKPRPQQEHVEFRKTYMAEPKPPDLTQM